MGPKSERVQSSLFPECIQGEQVGVYVIDPIRVRRIPILIPLGGSGLQVWDWEVLVQWFVVNRVESHHLKQRLIKVGVDGRIQGDVKQGPKYIVDHILEVGNESLLLIHGVQSRNLDHPSNSTWVQLVLYQPLPHLMPFLHLLSVHRHPPLAPSVLGFLQLLHDFLCYLSQISSLDVVVLLQEHLPQLRSPERIVFVIESIKPLEYVLICLNI